MPQIAQQEYIVMPLSAYFSLMTDEEKRKIQEYHKQGVLMDVIFGEPGSWRCRIIADLIDIDDTIVVWDMENQEVTAVDVSISE
jgi:hypothetical protein